MSDNYRAPGTVSPEPKTPFKVRFKEFVDNHNSGITTAIMCSVLIVIFGCFVLIVSSMKDGWAKQDQQIEMQNADPTNCRSYEFLLAPTNPGRIDYKTICPNVAHKATRDGLIVNCKCN